MAYPPQGTGMLLNSFVSQKSGFKVTSIWAGAGKKTGMGRSWRMPEFLQKDVRCQVGWCFVLPFCGMSTTIGTELKSWRPGSRLQSSQWAMILLCWTRVEALLLIWIPTFQGSVLSLAFFYEHWFLDVLFCWNWAVLLCVLACLKTAFKFLPEFSLIHTGIRIIFAYQFQVG